MKEKKPLKLMHEAIPINSYYKTKIQMPSMQLQSHRENPHKAERGDPHYTLAQ